MQQADHEGDIDQTLEELGFRIPKTRGRRLADIVVPAVLPVGLITMLFWVFLDAGRWAMGWGEGKHESDVVLGAFSPAVAATVMYGSAVFIALKGRATQIEEKTWRDGSAKCLIPIALKAGVVTWGVIVVATVIDQFPQAWRSLIAMVQGLKLFVSGAPADATTEGWGFLPIKIITAFPWMLVGGTASAVLAILLSGDVRRIDRPERICEALMLGVAVAVAAAVAQCVQFAFMDKLEGQSGPLEYVLLVALAAFTCGAVVGYKVPVSCRINLVTPLDPIMARALRDLLAQANGALGNDVAARDWVFAPNSELDGITPAEAVQYKTQATGVGRLLEAEAAHRREEARSERPTPKAIDGGRYGADRPRIVAS